MSLRINQNIDALNSYRNLSVTQGQMSKSLEKLSSGFRINRAADDAAGLAISEGLRSQVGGLKVAVRNAQDGVSVVQTAEGALTEVHSILQRVRDLSVQAANDGSNNTESKQAIQSEIDELASALNDIADRTEFNGTKLLDGSRASLSFQVGSNSGDTLTVNMANVSAVATAVEGIDVTAASVAGTPGTPGNDGPDGIAGNGDDVAATPATPGTGAAGAIEVLDTQIGDGLHRPCRPGCVPEPARAHDQLAERRGREPVGVGEPDPRHRHGVRDDELHPFSDPLAGRYRDAGAGQPGPAGRALAAALTWSSPA